MAEKLLFRPSIDLPGIINIRGILFPEINNILEKQQTYNEVNKLVNTDYTDLYHSRIFCFMTGIEEAELLRYPIGKEVKVENPFPETYYVIRRVSEHFFCGEINEM